MSVYQVDPVVSRITGEGRAEFLMGGAPGGGGGGGEGGGLTRGGSGRRGRGGGLQCVSGNK